MKPKKIGTVTTVNAATGEVVGVKRNAMALHPPKGDVCPECAAAHGWDQPHNQQSLYYQMHFHARHGRWPTWTEAMAHCPDAIKAAWREQLVETMTEKGLAIPDDLKDDAGAQRGGR